MASSRKHSHPGRVLVFMLVLVLLAAGILAGGIYFKKTGPYPELALDLQGGTQIILTPKDTKEISKGRLDQAINIIRQRIDASGVAEAEIASQGGQNIVVGIPGNPSDETLDLVRSSALLRFRPVIEVGGPTPMVPATIEAKDDKGKADAKKDEKKDSKKDEKKDAKKDGKDKDAKKDDKSATQPPQQALETDPKKIAENAMKIADVNHDGKLSDEPTKKPTSNSDFAWRTEKAVYDFMTKDCLKKDNEVIKDDPKKPLVACDMETHQKFLLGPVDVEGKEVTQANASLGQTQNGGSTGRWVVNLEFSSKGAEQFKAVSERLIKWRESDPEAATALGPQAAAMAGGSPVRNQFAIVVDGKVISAPGIKSVIGDGRAEISGNFTRASAASLANQLKFGALPLNFEVQSQEHISATLGSEHLEKGLWAGLAGLILVALYLIWQYRGLSFIAIGSLVSAAVIVYLSIALLSWRMGYRLSLAGVAGLIVAVGITADSFIVYFERIRDEVRDGRPLTAAVNEGWTRAKRTIVASDAINLLAAVVLYFLAVGGVQGFAFTLGLTTLVDLMIVFMFTHPLMLLVIKTKFFGQGHKLSGLDPEHLGATRATYAGRGRIRMPKARDNKSAVTEEASK